MICPVDRKQMVNFVKEPDIEKGMKEGKIVPLPSGGIATDDVYETWYVYECPACGRRCKESYRCEVIEN